VRFGCEIAIARSPQTLPSRSGRELPVADEAVNAVRSTNWRRIRPCASRPPSRDAIRPPHQPVNPAAIIAICMTCSWNTGKAGSIDGFVPFDVRGQPVQFT